MQGNLKDKGVEMEILKKSVKMGLAQKKHIDPHSLFRNVFLDEQQIHQIFSPISNSQSTNFLANIYHDLFFN